MGAVELVTLAALTEEVVVLPERGPYTYGFKRRARFPDGKEYEWAETFQAETAADCVAALNIIFAHTTVAFARAYHTAILAPEE